MDNSSDSPKPTDFPLLSTINSPQDVQALDIDQLLVLAEEIRQSLITNLSNTGGHLGPNLGVVELTIALHSVFNTPKDQFVFDVAHQGYVHKMLTGRAKEIHTIRTYKGLNGFLLRSESEHDAYGAGHAGTAVSAALGMASGRDLAGEDDTHVVAVAGDAAFTCGPTLEALNNRSAKNLLFPNVLFEKFGLRYFGPIDGHDLPLLVKTFEYLKEQDEPVILHIITEKGRGYQPALDKPGKFHGLGPYKVEDGSTAAASLPTYSELFGRAITDFAKQDEKITAITAAMPGGTKLDIFKKELNERYFDVALRLWSSHQRNEAFPCHLFHLHAARL